jgi:putative thioredoxin
MAMDPSGMSLQGAFDLSGLVRKNQAPPAGGVPPVAGSSSALVRDITESQMADIVALSQTVPVILEFYGQGHQPALGSVVESFGGRLVLATIDVATSPELVTGLGITGIPTVFAIIQGRPAPLFQGIPPEDDIRKLFAEVLQVASQSGVTGRVDTGVADDGDQGAPEPAEPEWLLSARQAVAANDFDGARTAYETGLAEDPRHGEALAGLARVELLRRVWESGQDQATIRQAAADAPDNLDAQFLVADLDVSGGHLEDAFRRLLGLYALSDDDRKQHIRQRLIELFDAGGAGHPAVVAARQQLTSLLY